MDRDFILELFAEFGPVKLRRMFSGYGISADGVNFAMALRSGLIFRVDEQTVARYDAEGAKPFSYDTKKRTVIVTSYRHLPERLYDDPEELALWARKALEAARRAAIKKPKSSKAPSAAKSGPAVKTKHGARKKRQAT